MTGKAAPLRGVVTYHCFYPGRIQLPIPSFFRIEIDRRPALVGLLSHRKAINAIDFVNEILEDPEARSKVALRRRIDLRDRHLIAVQTTDRFGSKGTSLVVDASAAELVVSTAYYSELVFRSEVLDPDAPDRGPLQFLEAVGRLVSSYRFVTRDVGIPLVSVDDVMIPPIAISVERLAYSDPQPGSGAYERLLRIGRWEHCRPEIIRSEYPRKLNPPLVEDPDAVAAEVAARLSSNAKTTAEQEALFSAYEAVVVGRSPRLALVEVCSLVEVVLRDFLKRQRARDPALDGRLHRLERKHRLTCRRALSEVLCVLRHKPPLGSDPMPKFLHRALNARDATLHERAEVTIEAAIESLNGAQLLLSASWQFERSLGASAE